MLLDALAFVKEPIAHRLSQGAILVGVRPRQRMAM